MLPPQIERYLAAGWRVLPLHAPGAPWWKTDIEEDQIGKRPCVSRGADPLWGSSNRDEAIRWARRWPGCNWGLGTGAGLVVLDLDSAEQWAQLRELTLRNAPLPPTAIAGTGRNPLAAHIYFAGDLDRSPHLGDILVRGARSYVVAPPSIHRTEQPYRWLTNFPVAPLPDWLKSCIETYEKPTKTVALPPPPDYIIRRQQLSGAPSLLAREIAWTQSPRTPELEAEIKSALQAIPPSIKMLPWLGVGMALHSLGWGDDPFAWWVAWSRSCEEKFSEARCESAWRSFGRRTKGAIGIGTLWFLATRHGWVRPNAALGAAATPASARINGHHTPTLLPPATALEAIEFDVNKRGVLPTCVNARRALRKLEIACRYDTFHERLHVGGRVLGQWAGELSDHADHMLRVIIQEKFGFDPGMQNIHDAAVEECLLSPFDPVVDYLARVEGAWDGRARLGGWLHAYLGSPWDGLTGAFGRLTVLAAVRRARRPGWKHDAILVLEGPEGRGKSAAIEMLAGADNFSDQAILLADDRHQQELIQGVWLYEIAELVGKSAADIERVKAFASRTVDRTRPAYGRCRVDRPRRCVFVATTNNETGTYLRAEGNRRFWPVPCGRIDLERLARDRDQIWGEAAALEARGATTTLDPTLWAAAGAMQASRREADPWDDLLEVLDLKGTQGVTIAPSGDGRGHERRVSTGDIWTLRLQLDPGRLTTATSKRLASAMKRLGWDGPKKIRGLLGTYRGYSKPI
ncbi:MAG: VapE domain-containing protein [Solirubrobacteraceae bacterium]